MSNFNALLTNDANFLQQPESNLGLLPARLTKRLWVSPREFLLTTNASQIATWAIQASCLFILHYLLRVDVAPNRTIKTVVLC